MTTSTVHARSRLGAALTTLALVLGGLVATAGSAQAAAAPANLRAAHVATKGIGLTWNVTGEDAYRVRFSTSSSMKTATDTWDVLGNYYEWTRTDANPGALAPRLTPGKTYYFQVKAVTRSASSATRKDLSGYSKPVAVTLPKTGLPEIKPVGLKATPGGGDSMHVSWRSRGPGYSYVLRYTTDPSAAVLKWKSVKMDSPGGPVTGLAPGKRYHFRARVIDANGTGQSPYSSTGFSATTGASTSSPALSVVSYNIQKAYAGTGWATRRKPVAANITSLKPDVLALQESTPGTDGTANGAKQYDDIVNLLGSSKYALTTRAGSSGTKIVYNTERLSLVTAGVKALTTVGTATRYASWATLKDKRSGKTFFAINTHLEPGSNASSAFNDARIKQSREVLALIDQHSGGRPVVITGDMNSSRVATPENGQYRTFTSAGFVDPTNNPSSTWLAGSDAAAEHLLDVEYNAFNNRERKARRTAFPVGTNVDYVYVSPSIRVASWRTVVKVDTNGSFVGTIPSDHNAIATMLHLP